MASQIQSGMVFIFYYSGFGICSNSFIRCMLTVLPFMIQRISHMEDGRRVVGADSMESMAFENSLRSRSLLSMSSTCIHPNRDRWSSDYRCRNRREKSNLVIETEETLRSGYTAVASHCSRVVASLAVLLSGTKSSRIKNSTPHISPWYGGSSMFIHPH